MKNVLVFPCGSEIGLEIHRSVQFSTHFNLIGGSSVNDHGMFVYRNYVSDLPFIEDPDFVEKLNEVIIQYGIDYIFPAHDSVVLKLAEEADRNNLKCKVIVSTYETCDIARSKLKSYKVLQDVMLVPKIYADIEQVKPDDFPIFLKPDVGQGSKGTYLVKNKEDAKFYIKKDPSLLILEYLPGREYTIDCFTDNSGRLLFVQGRVRARISNGISVNSQIVQDKRFQDIAKKINKNIKFTGAWFFQVKENKIGDLALLEIAPRIAGTMGLTRATGVNLPLLSIFNAEGYKLDIFKNEYEAQIDRALQNCFKLDISYKHAYIDFDDLLIFNNRVNPAAVAFVFQCINSGVKVHLITRHTENLIDTLATYRLNGLFDEVVWLKEGEKKSDHIVYKESIFIDDSYAERKDVHDKLGIPVFDAHALEALMR